MNTNHDQDRTIFAWLSEGPAELADRVLDAALDEVHLTRQRPRLARPWRTQRMTSIRWWPAVGAAAVIIVAVMAVLVLRPSSNVGAVASPSPSAAAAPSTVAGAVGSTGASRSASPSVASSPATFLSKVYGYTVTVPAGWLTTPATAAWDGIGSPGIDDAHNDQWDSGTGPAAFARANPFAGDLAAYTRDAISRTATYHGDTCPPTPASNDPTTIGEKPGSLLTWNCGILINIAVTVDHGVGYFFVFRDPSVKAATDPTDGATFKSILDSVRFPA